MASQFQDQMVPDNAGPMAFRDTNPTDESITSGFLVTQEQRGSVELLRSSNESLSNFESTEEACCCPDFESRPRHIDGFWVMEAANLDEALAWARKAAVACRAPVEVRPFKLTEAPTEVAERQ